SPPSRSWRSSGHSRMSSQTITPPGPPRRAGAFYARATGVPPAVRSVRAGDGRALDELVEVALLAPGGAILHQQHEVAAVELLEPLVPGDGLQGLLAAVAGEVEPEHPDVVAAAGALDAGGAGAALLGPAPDLFVVGQWVCARH